MRSFLEARSPIVSMSLFTRRRSRYRRISDEIHRPTRAIFNAIRVMVSAVLPDGARPANRCVAAFPIGPLRVPSQPANKPIAMPPRPRQTPRQNSLAAWFACCQIRRMERPNEKKMSDGGRGGASLGVEVWKSSQKWSVQRPAVRSIARLCEKSEAKKSNARG